MFCMVYFVQALSLPLAQIEVFGYGCGERITRNMGRIYKRRGGDGTAAYSCLDIMYLLQP